MLHKIKMFFVSSMALIGLLAPMAVAGVVSAQTSQSDINSGLCSGANGKLDGKGGTTCTGGTSELQKLITKIINLISVAAGIVAVIMIVVGGFRYVTSGGKQESITGAKNTILYALIGLVIIALAQIVVHFVLGNVTPNTQ